MSVVRCTKCDSPEVYGCAEIKCPERSFMPATRRNGTSSGVNPVAPHGNQSPGQPDEQLVNAAREWILRHSSQPDGDRWSDDPSRLDWAAENLLVDLTPWLDDARAAAAMRAYRSLQELFVAVTTKGEKAPGARAEEAS